jgi:hypothetical protein
MAALGNSPLFLRPEHRRGHGNIHGRGRRDGLTLSLGSGFDRASGRR